MTAYDPDALRRMVLQPVSSTIPTSTTSGIQVLPPIIQTAEVTTLPQSLAAFLAIGNWLDRDLPPPEPLLGEVITNTTRMFIGGPTGLGKSHLGMAMAAGMATGQGFAHWKSQRPCKVLYIDGEMARDLVKRRLADLLRRISPEDRAPVMTNLHVLCLEDCEEIAQRYPKLGTMAPLNTKQGQEFLLRLIDMMGKPDAIFIDNRMSILSGDMKEEQPWTDTMPLVKELTQRRIAQIWVDHTGHDTTKIYGTKTKEWQFDSVALLSKVDRPDADISFNLEFQKARRQEPSNRADFGKMTFAMVNDKWTFGPAAEGSAAGGVKNKLTLTLTERGWMDDIHELFAEPGAAVRRNVPALPGTMSGPLVLTLTQEQLRAGLVKRERLKVTPNGALTEAARVKLSTMLNALKDKRKLYRADGLIWLHEQG